jgi:Ca2+-binding EF-hand superfamily protein
LITDLEDEDDEGDVKRAFSLFEKDGSIEKKDLLNVFVSCGKSLSDDQLNSLVENYETEKADQFTFDEFMEVYHASDDVM